jgi:hypothetical protein
MECECSSVGNDQPRPTASYSFGSGCKKFRISPHEVGKHVGGRVSSHTTVFWDPRDSIAIEITNDHQRILRGAVTWLPAGVSSEDLVGRFRALFIL